VPESFRVLVKELQGLGLDVEVEFDDGSHGDIPMEDDERPIFAGKPPEVFSAPKKPRKSRAKPQQSDAPVPDILSEPVETEPEIPSDIADALFGSDEEPTAEDLEHMTEEMMLDESTPKSGISGIFDDPESNGEGDI
ncbi:MAG: hypothetical protein IJL10_04100, partial [Synergistaceae bacterium]|nr:hypothetical protein [Synergistaceae bacterium]